MRNNRRPIRAQYISSQAKNNQSEFWGKAQKIITVIIGLGGLFTFLLWITGRGYAAGYFTAMNIPSFVVDFVTWEYLEQVWLPLSIFLAGLFSLYLILDLILHIVAYGIKKLIAVLKIRSPRTRLHGFLSEIKPNWKLYKYLAVWVGICSIIFFGLSYVYTLGLANGNNYVLLAAKNINIVTNVRLDISASSQSIDSSGTTQYSYNNLKLLTHNNGKYFLFSEFDTTTCKPTQVVVIDDTEIILAAIMDATPIDAGNCLHKIYHFLFFIRIPATDPIYQP